MRIDSDSGRQTQVVTTLCYLQSQRDPQLIQAQASQTRRVVVEEEEIVTREEEAVREVGGRLVEEVGVSVVIHVKKQIIPTGNHETKAI